MEYILNTTKQFYLQLIFKVNIYIKEATEVIIMKTLTLQREWVKKVNNYKTL